MNINILQNFLFGIAGGQEEDHTFVKFTNYPLTMIALLIWSFIAIGFLYFTDRVS